MIIIKKKSIIIIALLFVIGLSIYLVSNKSNADQSVSLSNHKEEQIEENKTEEEQEDEKEEVTEQDTLDEEEDNPPSDPVKDFIIDAVDFLFKRDVHIFAIGDSLTQGVGDPSGEGGYVGILDQTINKDDNRTVFSNFGKRGNRTDQLLERLDDPEITTEISDADIIMITIGANDIMQVVKENFTNLTYEKFTEEQVLYEERLTKIFDKINELNSKADIYLLGFYNPFDEYFKEIEELDLIIDNWNEATNDITETFDNATFIPIKDLFDDSSIHLFADDHFHPNRIGYYRMAERVLDYLTKEEG